MHHKHCSGEDTTSKAPSTGVWTWFANGFVFEKEVKGPAKAKSPKPCGLKIFDWNFNKYAVLNRTSSERRRYANVTSRAFHIIIIPYTPRCASFNSDVAHS